MPFRETETNLTHGRVVWHWLCQCLAREEHWQSQCHTTALLAGVRGFLGLAERHGVRSLQEDGTESVQPRHYQAGGAMLLVGAEGVPCGAG